MALQPQTVKARAYLYSSPKPVLVDIATEVPRERTKWRSLTGPGNYIARLNYLEVDPIFTEHVDLVHDCVVAVGGRRFLICSHYEPSFPPNDSVQSEFFGLRWQGEIVVAEIGRKPMLAFINLRPYRPVVKRAMVRYAFSLQSGSTFHRLSRFLSEALMALHSQTDIPKKLTA